MLRKMIGTLAALTLASGCASIGSMQTADTLGKGNLQFGVEPGVWGAAAIRGDAEGFAFTHLDVALRYGVSDTVDIGGRLGSSLAEFQTKFLLTDPSDPSKAISLAPAVSGILIGSGDGGGGYTHLQVPLLFGLKTRGGSEFVVGPRISNATFFGLGGGSDGMVNILSAGASVGYAARLGKGFRLMPEVAVLVPLVGASALDGESDAAVGFGGGLVQLKVGFLFGEGRPGTAPVE